MLSINFLQIFGLSEAAAYGGWTVTGLLSINSCVCPTIPALAGTKILILPKKAPYRRLFLYVCIRIQSKQKYNTPFLQRIP
jgi:hypothetical protein